MVSHTMIINTSHCDSQKQNLHRNSEISMDFICKIQSVRRILRLVKLFTQHNG